ncbi:DHA2 family multidrug resistance protein-like MFS transporter [Pseudonocardia kunmingensis]|uniref:DHA2 family multidrug resistance protein-like MFS transporter n=1 Tax=Pseudonocardia kunmingensis TaxID=630975 RepID=A0A543DR14_9PSEU|nr:DHA2 family multidrug resistance protein-like MFS transporter [Pseudonocardia kunmingensis]
MDVTAGTRAGRREWLALGVLALPTAVLSMDLTALHLAAPSISADLAPSAAQLLWILDVYGFVMAGFLLVMGSVGDRVGRRRLLLIGAAAFVVASVLASLATTAEALIAARALLGLAGATLMPSTLALLADTFTVPAQRAFAIAFWMVAFTAGEAMGPVVGGVLLEFFWWGSVFLVAVPVMVLLLILGPFLLPESSRDLSGRFDLGGAVLLLVGLLSFVHGIKQVATDGVAWSAAAWVAAGPALGIVFVRRQLRSRDPLMDLRLFGRFAFSAGLGAQMLAVAAVAGTQLLVMQYLQATLGLTPLHAGLWTVPSVLLGIGATLLAPVLARRVRPAAVVAVGLGTAAIGAAVVTVTAPAMSLAWTVVGFTVLYVGVTPTLALTTDLIVGAAPPERAGTASGVAESGAELGLALGIALIGTAAMARYRTLVVRDAPAEVAGPVVEDAGRTVGGGLAAAEGLPVDAGVAMLETVRSSFAGAVQLAAALSAMVLVVGAGLAVGLLRGERRGTPSTPDSPEPADELR